jgi:peptidoglycan/LPS O-acetylase OafA/YrhL
VSVARARVVRRRVIRRRLGYRPGLDGLRGVAVIAVMAFHGGVPWLPGGFLGVDLFFVLSGFLITTLLLEEWGSTGRIRLARFWARRARRLFPALALMLAVVAVYGATLAPPVTRDGLRWDGLASLLYVANWRFVLGHQSYFAGFAAPSPLRHMWSLAVEEQWYLIWPPTLVAILGWLRHRVPPLRKLDLLAVLLAVLTLASVAQMVRLDLVTHGAADSGRSYYGTDTHIQVLLTGALLAVVWLRRPPESPAARQRWRAGGLVGGAVCLTMFFATAGSDRWLYEGGFLLFAVAGALVVASVVVPGAALTARVLASAPLRAVGRVSYGLYLWHWPVDVCLNPARVHVDGPVLLVLRTAVAVTFALVSYHLVEVPIRTGRLVLRRPLPTLGLTAAGLAAALTVLPGIGATAATVAVSVPRHFRPPPARVASTVIPAVPPGRTIGVLVVGDSVGQALTAMVTPPPGLRFTNASIEGCGVTFGAAIVGGYPIYDVSQCPEAQQRQAWLAGLSTHPDVVVMSFGTWEVFDQRYDDRTYRVGTTAYATLLGDQLQSDVDFVAGHSNARIVLLDVPCYDETSYDLGGATSPRNDPSRVAWVNGVFRHVAEANPGRVTLEPISAWACPGGRFEEERDGVVLRPDGVHYDPQSATLTWDDWLGPRVRALARRTIRVPRPGPVGPAPRPPTATAPAGPAAATG